jgi:hypothetical protein
MAKKLFIGFVIALACMLVAIPVLAAYYLEIDVIESSGTSYTMLPVMATLNISNMVNNGFITSSGLDVRVKNAQGSNIPFMLATDKVVFASPITGNAFTKFQLTTGSTPLTSFPVCVGHGGYVTITDNTTLELSNNFSIEFQGYEGYDSISPICPTVLASATSYSGSGMTSHNVTLPSGVKSGYLLVMLVGGYGGTYVTITWPTGWTELAQNNTSGYCSGVAYRFADGTEGASATLTTSASISTARQVLAIAEYKGIPEIATSDKGTTANPDSPILTPSWGSDATLWITAFGGGNSASRTMSSYPDDYSGGQYTESTPSGYAEVGSAYRELTAASEDPGQFILSGTATWWAWTIGIQGGYRPLVNKAGAFRIYTPSANSISATVEKLSPIIVNATGIISNEAIIKVYIDGGNLKIDIDGVNKDLISLGGSSVNDNSVNWTLSMPFFAYYKHAANSTLRVLYQPDEIISGTTLPNMMNPGTYDGIITWGSNPAGIDVTNSILQTEGTSYYNELPQSITPSIINPVSPPLTNDVQLAKLQSNPLYPIIHALSDASGGLLPERTIWLGGAWLAVFLAMGVAFFGIKSKRREANVPQNMLFAGLIGLGVTCVFYALYIFPWWAVGVMALGVVANVVWERAWI